ncbi:hypothetical protein KC19_8G127200 [Ceratodon purpureus]|uniref:Uncharacterized protein n=1 Tax=Ceratodon purpureus TaxID=3225 RepID=A0A8T0H2S4_CERPU|nr:hypothetical protein KC19_8G127200 [Ceratodon purpureus]
MKKLGFLLSCISPPLSLSQLTLLITLLSPTCSPLIAPSIQLGNHTLTNTLSLHSSPPPLPSLPHLKCKMAKPTSKTSTFG